MKIKTFQIENCFGFNDSGEVNLQDKNNFIYVLGRNSSGKSSLLNSLRCFTEGVILKDQRNFQNFNNTNAWSGLTATFCLQETKLSIDQYVVHLSEHLGQGVPQQAMEQDNVKESIDKIKAIYGDLINKALHQQNIDVAKNHQGEYMFSPNAKWDEYELRGEEVRKVLTTYFGQALQIHYANANYGIQVTKESIENLLIKQFPRVFLFNEAYRLNDDLPERIDANRLQAKDNNTLLSAFINYLGRDTIIKFLKSNDPDERDEYLSSLREKTNSLIEKVNQYNTDSKNKERLVEIVLHEKNGLQITVKTDGKKSYYSHLSDNTKFLFAYYLLSEVVNLKRDILLFDEPSNGFHPSAQTFLLNFLISLAKENLVVVSTHSEHLIDLSRLSGVRIMTTDSSNNILVKNHIYQKAKGAGDYFALQPILDAIGLKYGQQINLRDKVIIVEGITDLFYLRAFNVILGQNVELNIAPARGDSTMLSLIPLLISQGISFKIILDTGNIKNEIQKAYGLQDEFIFEIPIPINFQGKMKQSGIEDLFTKQDFEKMLNKIGQQIDSSYLHVSNNHYIKDGPKRLLAHNFYENSRSYKPNEFDKETINYFTDVLKFCEEDKWFSL
jgi:predicted ATP-dependent endonuclease of OLD family